jgi:hypothetical protein
MANFACLTASAALAPIVVVGLIGAAAVSEYRYYMRGEPFVRQAQVAAQDPVQNVPCDVAYSKDTEQPGVRSVLGSAQSDAAYCTRRELVAKLEGGGRSYAPDEGATTEATYEFLPAKPEPEIAAAAAAPEDKPASAVLEAIIEQNLLSLNEGVKDRFAADIGGYGDLDLDGLADGLVFFTYASERLGQSRFVAAYLYDGESYALAATKLVAGSADNVHRAAIDSIDDGVISLRLSVLEPGDASCCPSGERQQKLVLRDGQLVEVMSSASPILRQAEQTSATKPSQGPLALSLPRADDAAESEKRAKSVRDERAAEARGRQVETDAESPERAFEAAARSSPRPPAAAAPAAGSGTRVGGSPSGAQSSPAAPLQSGRALQAAADPARPGAAARLPVASEASSVGDRPAADIRVFIHHVAHQGDATLARRLADHLQRRGFIVADIRPVDFSIGKPSVRYFFTSDRAASRRLVEEVSRFFKETPSQAPDEPSDFTHFIPKPRPGNVEVWLPVW